MSILLAMMIGVVVGGIGGFLLMDGIDLLVLNLVMGLVGGLVGLGIFTLAFAEIGNLSLFEPRSLMSSALFALIFVLIFNILHKIMPKRAANVASTDEKQDIENLED